MTDLKTNKGEVSLLSSSHWQEPSAMSHPMRRRSRMGGVFVISVGLLSVFMGFAKLVFNWQSKALTLFSLFWVQTSWISYITGMTGVGRTARSGMGFIPAEYNPTASDVRFVGACGILAILAYGFCFIGSISFTQFAFYAHLTGKSSQRSDGAWTSGHCSHVFRSHDFGAVIFAAWVLQVILHVLVQVGFVSGGGAVGAAPTIVGFSVGLNLMPAYLDHKSRDLPAIIPVDYYSDNVEIVVESSSASSSSVEVSVSKNASDAEFAA